MKRSYLILLFASLAFGANAQKANKEVYKGNKFYEKEKYIDAEIEYKKGMLKEHDAFGINFNLGNAFFRQKQYNDALKQYENSIALSKGDKLKQAAAYHNIGNALLQENKIDESIEAYKESLRRNSSDDETRYNLAFAQYLQRKTKEDGDGGGDGGGSDEKEEQTSPPQAQPEESQISKENAEQILNSLAEDETETMREINRETRKEVDKIEKKW